MFRSSKSSFFILVFFSGGLNSSFWCWCYPFICSNAFLCLKFLPKPLLIIHLSHSSVPISGVQKISQKIRVSFKILSSYIRFSPHQVIQFILVQPLFPSNHVFSNGFLLSGHITHTGFPRILPGFLKSFPRDFLNGRYLFNVSFHHDSDDQLSRILQAFIPRSPQVLHNPFQVDDKNGFHQSIVLSKTSFKSFFVFVLTFSFSLLGQPYSGVSQQFVVVFLIVILSI